MGKNYHILSYIVVCSHQHLLVSNRIHTLIIHHNSKQQFNNLIIHVHNFPLASVISMEKTPEVVKPGISKTLTLRCELVDSVATTIGTGLVGRSVPSTTSNVQHLSSLAIFKDGTQIASVTTFSGVFL